jgi:hypothetical protein
LADGGIAAVNAGQQPIAVELRGNGDHEWTTAGVADVMAPPKTP